MADRVTIVADVEVNRPASEVFDYLTDVARHSEWSPRAYRVEGISAGEHVVAGQGYTSYGWLPNDKDHRNEVKATEVRSPDRLVLTSSEGGQDFVNTFTLTASGERTRVQRTMDMPKPGGVLGVVFPVLKALLIRPDISKGLNNLKARLETGT